VPIAIYERTRLSRPTYFIRSTNFIRSSKPLVACLLVLTACSVGRRHVSDATLEKNFLRHEAEFQALIADVRMDKKLTMIDRHSVHYGNQPAASDKDFSDIERLGLTRERWMRLQNYLTVLGLVRIFQADDSIDLEVEQESTFNLGSRKGYEYNSSLPPGHRRANLDDYRTSQEDRISPFRGYMVWKPLKGNWYLYLFVG
jgi:hypothetical protein